MSYVTSWERFAREEGYALGIEKGIEKGMQKGIERGRQEGQQLGRQEGEQRALLRLLEARFGVLTAAVTARVRAADADQLERWMPRVLTAASADEVCADD